MNMGKTVLLIRNVAPDKYGGGESYQLELAEQLRRNEFRPVVVTSSSRLINEAKKRKIEVAKAPYYSNQNWSGWKNVLFPVYCIWQVRLKRWYKRIFEKYRPEVINVQSRDDFIAATKVAKKMGVRVLWTDHMDFRSWVLTNVNVWYKNWVGKWIVSEMKKADAVIMISDFEREWFEKQMSPRKYNNVVTIKNGVRDEYANYKDIRAIKDSFCYVGRVVDYKGVNELLKAFKIVRKEIPETKLNIYGDGELKKYMKVAGDGVSFCGYTDKPLKVMAENEVFVLPSYFEGLSIALLEAAMMKKKIIASNVDGNPEVVINKKTGLLVPPKDVEKLAEAMMEILRNHKESDEMAKNARKYYEENFDFEKIFKEKMLDLYDTNH